MHHAIGTHRPGADREQVARPFVDESDFLPSMDGGDPLGLGERARSACHVGQLQFAREFTRGEVGLDTGVGPGLMLGKQGAFEFGVLRTVPAVGIDVSQELLNVFNFSELIRAQRSKKHAQERDDDEEHANAECDRRRRFHNQNLITVEGAL